MNQNRVYLNILWIILGSILIALSFMKKVDSFWSGCGSAFFLIGCLQLLKYYRLKNNKEYQETMKIIEQDERFHFIRNKALAWAGYTFIVICGAMTFVFKFMNLEELSIICGFNICIILILYVIFYAFLGKKY